MNAQLLVRTSKAPETWAPSKSLSGRLLDGRNEGRLIREGVRSVLRGDGACVNLFIELYDSLDTKGKSAALSELMKHFDLASAVWNLHNENPYYSKETNELAAVRLASALERIATRSAPRGEVRYPLDDYQEWLSERLRSIIQGGAEDYTLRFEPMNYNGHGGRDSAQGEGFLERLEDRLENPAKTHWWAKALRWMVRWTNKRFQKFDDKCAECLELSAGSHGRQVLERTPHEKMMLAGAKLLWALERNPEALEEFTRSPPLLGWTFNTAVAECQTRALRVYAYHRKYISRLLQSEAGRAALENELAATDGERNTLAHDKEEAWQNLSQADRAVLVPLLAEWARAGNAVPAVMVAGNSESIVPGDRLGIVSLSLGAGNLEALSLAAEMETMSWAVGRLERSRLLPLLGVSMGDEQSALQALRVAGVSETMLPHDKLTLVACAFRNGYSDALEELMHKRSMDIVVYAFLSSSGEGRAFVTSVLENAEDKAALLAGIASVRAEYTQPLLADWLKRRETAAYALRVAGMLEVVPAEIRDKISSMTSPETEKKTRKAARKALAEIATKERANKEAEAQLASFDYGTQNDTVTYTAVQF